jgi:ATP-dependent Clp protease protease subunit
VDDSSVGKVMSEVAGLDQKLPKGQPIYLVLYTPGGSVQSGLEMIEFLRSLNRPIHTITIAAASMGWQILQHLDNRYVFEYSILMSHRARGGVEGEFGGEQDSQLIRRYRFWEKRIKEMDKQTVLRTKGKQTLESYTKDYENELWISGKEAVAKGYADKITKVVCDKSLNGFRTEEVQGSFFSVKAKVSMCPINRGVHDVKAYISTNQGWVEQSEFVARGGVLGAECSLANTTGRFVTVGLCALDRTLTLEKIESEKRNAINRLSSKSFNPVNYF